MTTAEAEPATRPGTERVVVRLLGPFAVTAHGQAAGPWPRPTARRLLQLVLVSPGRRASRDLACEALFPGMEPRAAARALSKALSMARAALAPLGEPAASILQADLTHVWVVPGPEVDAEAQLAALRGALALRPGPDRARALVAALADDGELLADEPYADWAIPPREHLESIRQEARLTAARDLARDLAREAGQAAGDPEPGPEPGPEAVMAAWLTAFEHDPASEEAAGALLRGYLRQGRRELAARTYERCAAALADLGLRTSPSLDQLYAAVTVPPPGGRPDRAAPAAPAASAGPAAPAASATAPGSRAPVSTQREELRPVTVLFAEVSAPSGPARLDPEAIREVVGTALAAVIAEVEALGGRVTSVSGRGLQALWGAPQAHEDDPERALRSAYRSLSAVASLPAPAPALRIGVETGPAVVGPIGGGGRVEYGALGDVVSVAADLQSLARPASALVGAVTRAAAGHLFTWGPEEAPREGPPEAAGATYLGEPLAQPGQLPRAARGPLVGRAAEAAVLESAVRDAISGRGSVVLLRAEPGLGKTRLVQECRERFMAWVGAREGRLPLWLEGRAASYASATPYGLYRQLLAGWIGVAPDQARPDLSGALERALTALLASTDLLPVLEHVMGLAPAPAAAPAGRQDSPEELRRAAFQALRTVMSRLVPARRPGVIVLEDLHWADPTSLQFTLELITLAADRPLLILATTRPDAGPEVDALARHAAVRTVTLRPLPPAAARDLAAALLGGTTGVAPGDQVLDAILHTVDGNPLFLEERLAALLEAGALARDPGGWWLRGEPGHAVPLVLDRLVRSRIDRLGPAAQEAVRIASVLGPEFPAALLTTIQAPATEAAGRTEAADGTEAAGRIEAAGTARALAELRSAGILQRVANAPAGAYRFRHALIQEAAYQGMLRADRRRLHASAAHAIEAAYARNPEEVAAILGRHFASAGDSPGKAIHYLELAGDRATWAFANDEAIAAYQEALAVASGASDADAGARLQARLANVLWRTARHDETRAAFTEALRLADLLPVPDPMRKAHLYTRLGRLEMADDRYDEAGKALDKALELLGDQPGDTDEEADEWLELMIDGRADQRMRVGDTGGGLAILDQVRPILEERGSPSRRYAFYLTLGMERMMRDHLRVDDQAIADVRRALQAARDSGDTKDIGYGTYFLGWGLHLRGDLAQAREQFQASLAIAERVGESLLHANSLGSLALVALGSHDVATVRDLAPRALAAGQALGRNHVAWVMAPLAWLAWQDGRDEDVIRIAREVDACDERADIPGTRYRWAYLFPLAAVFLKNFNTERAVAAVVPTLHSGQQPLPPPLAAAIEAARDAWVAGRHEEATAAIRAVLDLARIAGLL